MFIWTFFHHKNLGNHLLQLCPKVVKHPVLITNLMHQLLFIYLWNIIPLHVSSHKWSSSGGYIVYMQHMVLSLSMRAHGGQSVHGVSEFSLTPCTRLVVHKTKCSCAGSISKWTLINFSNNCYIKYFVTFTVLELIIYYETLNCTVLTYCT